MHDEIKRYELTGTITSDRFVSARDALIKELEASMRDDGYVPVLDFIPQFTRDYNSAEENFTFKLSIYAIYVGEASWHMAGQMNGTLIEKSTRPTKSSQS